MYTYIGYCKKTDEQFCVIYYQAVRISLPLYHVSQFFQNPRRSRKKLVHRIDKKALSLDHEEKTCGRKNYSATCINCRYILRHATSHLSFAWVSYTGVLSGHLVRRPSFDSILLLQKVCRSTGGTLHPHLPGRRSLVRL